MPRKSSLRLSPLDRGGEAVGERLARLRKERGFTQVELAERIGLLQTLVSDYERGRLRLNADMIIRFALALEVSTDEILRPARAARPAPKPSLRISRRLDRIARLPRRQQAAVLQALDLMLARQSGQAAR